VGASPLVEMLIKERYHVIVCHVASVGGRAAHHCPLHCLQGLLNTDCQSPLVILHVLQKSGSPAARGKPMPAKIKVCTAFKISPQLQTEPCKRQGRDMSADTTLSTACTFTCLQLISAPQSSHMRGMLLHSQVQRTDLPIPIYLSQRLWKYKS